MAAHRDPAVFDDPHKVDFDREGTGHVSFGHGPHHCMESEVMISTLLRRCPELRLAGPAEETVFQYKGLILGPRELVVTR
ncbi:hypothetical protein [Streptomyces sp. NPDC047981]|uniref:hypothetical protein n=1 Tax=Streptomyces sp. NPDC047981 TaxID=3154610 RepID=UPI003422F933